ncbi:YdeI/OmpD-associated family protein [Pedobacter sp. AW31-3R]|uniref:YdeI/OmpD-associated family protein n=1 Tax=Pedobacter sp. AW31-3R TaxID=3445781 RepID=UPI003FA003B7
MVVFTAEIERFEKMGEKTGWTYVRIPADTAQLIKADCKKSYRVKGKLDNVAVSGMAMVPMGEGDFIIALKSSLRKELKKEEGAMVQLALEEHKDFKIDMPEDLELCLSEEKHLLEAFLRLPKGHQNYYFNWLNSAKTEKTRTKRLTQIVIAMDKKMDFGEMIRANKQ